MTTDRVHEAYIRACEKGHFTVEANYLSYFDYEPNGHRYLKERKSEYSDIVFTAYDGYHLVLICLNKHADEICDAINAMRDEAKIQEYLEYYRKNKKVKTKE